MMGGNPSSEEAIVGNYRVYAGDDGQSHVAEFNLSLRPDLTNTDKIRGLQIRPPGSRNAQETADLANFHNAPNRRLATWLSGYTEVGLGRRQHLQLRPRRPRNLRGYHRPRPHHQGQRRHHHGVHPAPGLGFQVPALVCPQVVPQSVTSDKLFSYWLIVPKS